MRKEEKIYKYLQENPVHKFALENEIYAIIDHNFPEVKNCIYANGYIGLNVIEENIRKQEKIDQLEQENKVLKHTNKSYKGMLNKQNKIIDEMAEQLVGIAIWNNEKEASSILKGEEEVKQYFEKKVEGK